MWSNQTLMELGRLSESPLRKDSNLPVNMISHPESCH